MQTSSPSTSLSALLSLQTKTVMLCGSNTYYSAKRARVIGKLTNKAIASEHEGNPDTSFYAIDPKPVLTAMHECLLAVKQSQHQSTGREALLKPVEEMVNSIMMELVTSKKEQVRESLESLGLRDEPIWQVLSDCEKELGLTGSTLASLIQSVGESSGDQRTAAVAELSAFKESNPDMFQSHMLNLSAPFKEYIAEQLDKYSKKSDNGCHVSDKTQCLKVDPPAQLNELPGMASRDSFSNIKARIEALRQKQSGDHA